MSNKSDAKPQASRLDHKSMVFRLIGAVALLYLSQAGLVQPARAQSIGSASNLPLPRFVSLKYDPVNVREGPGKDHATRWIYQRAGLPVEVTAEFERWYKIRDSEGGEGWVLHSLLSGRRTALILQGKTEGNITLFAKPSVQAEASAQLQPGVVGNIKSCDGNWCRIYGDDYDGYIQQNNLWGVYPDEKIN
jgi:SH3-like domain-containing protein